VHKTKNLLAYAGMLPARGKIVQAVLFKKNGEEGHRHRRSHISGGGHFVGSLTFIQWQSGVCKKSRNNLWKKEARATPPGPGPLGGGGTKNWEKTVLFKTNRPATGTPGPFGFL